MKSTIFFTLAIAAFVNAAPFNRNGTTVRRRDLPARSGPVYSVYADVGTTAETWPSAENLGDWNDLYVLRVTFNLTDSRSAFQLDVVLGLRWERTT